MVHIQKSLSAKAERTGESNMKISDILDTGILYDNGIIPVICLTNDSELETLSRALADTALNCVEITFRHTYAPLAVKNLKKLFPKIAVGAGTIISEKILMLQLNRELTSLYLPEQAWK